MDFYANIKKPELILKPVCNSDLESIVKLKPNTTYKFSVVHPRNYEFHKKFFALLKNQEKYKTFEEYRLIKQMQSGYFKLVITEKGKVYLPESISFSNMDELEFETLYKNVLDQICKEIGCTSEEITQELVNFM